MYRSVLLVLLLGLLTGCGGGGSSNTVASSGAAVPAPSTVAGPAPRLTAPNVRFYAIAVDNLSVSPDGDRVSFQGLNPHVIVYTNGTATSDASIDVATLASNWAVLFGNRLVAGGFVGSDALFLMQQPPTLSSGILQGTGTLRQGTLPASRDHAVLLLDDVGGAAVLDAVGTAPLLVGQSAAAQPGAATFDAARKWTYSFTWQPTSDRTIGMDLVTDHATHQYRVTAGNGALTVEALDGGPLPSARDAAGGSLAVEALSATSVTFNEPDAGLSRSFTFPLNIGDTIHATATMHNIVPSLPAEIQPPVVSFSGSVEVEISAGVLTVPFANAPLTILEALFPSDGPWKGTTWNTRWVFSYVREVAPGVPVSVPLFEAPVGYQVGRDEASVSAQLMQALQNALGQQPAGGVVHVQLQVLDADEKVFVNLSDVVLSAVP